MRIKFVLLFLLIVSMCHAQTVSNARFEQVGKTIKIYYDLSEKADISIYLSTDGGRSYESSPLTNVSGDVGKDVSAGRDKKAVWDVLASRERLQGNKVCFKVRAAGQGSNRTITVNGVSFTMVYVAGGTFTMGCTSEQGGDYYPDEKPSHRVTLSGYYIGETEVTQQLWQAVMGSNPSYYKGEQRPVEQVSWNDCQEFIRRLNSKTGLHFALPTEAQWEYAARGGSESRGYIYSGSTNIGSVAWYDGNSSNQTHNVKGKQPNELGLYDMSGNVWEWCADWYGSYSSSSQTNPTGPSSGLRRVLRGGGWYGDAGSCRVTIRNGSDPSDRGYDSGLRLVLLPEGQPVDDEIEVVPPKKESADNHAMGQGSNRTITVNGVSFTMVYVAGGTFTMGCTSEQGGDCDSDEQPSHRVTLSDYYIGETEVTQQLWQAVMGSNPSYSKGEQRPVENVSWNDCQDFIRRLNNKTGLHFALPTEAQWEYAARGGSKSRGYKYSGSTNIGSVAWCGGISSSQTHNVKGKQPNELGLYDMSGNVWEWCADGDGSYSSSSQTNPTGPSSGLYRVKRGGSWDYSAWDCRVTHHDSYDPSGRSFTCGLRLVLLLEGQPVNEVTEEVSPQKTHADNSQYVDLGLPSGTRWKKENESGGFYTYDEAVEKFGDKLPTKEQFEELKNKCRWSRNSKGYYKATGPNGNFIFLPAAGWRDCSGSVDYVGSVGFYWSSTPRGSEDAWGLGLYSGGVDVYNFNRCNGFSVRLVHD